MLNELTTYLLHYGKASIPHVGTFEVIQKPATINFVDKLLAPPSYQTIVKKEEPVTEHQLAYLASLNATEKETVLDELNVFGKKLQEHMEHQDLEWNGIGRFSGWGNEIPFTTTALLPLPAERAQREKADHNVLIGNNQFTSQEATDALSDAEIKEERKSPVQLIGWILLGIALVVIGYILYKNGFDISSFGLKSSP